jgi:hypothetical protein
MFQSNIGSRLERQEPSLFQWMAHNAPRQTMSRRRKAPTALEKSDTLYRRKWRPASTKKGLIGAPLGLHPAIRAEKATRAIVHIGSQLTARTPPRPTKIPKGARVSDSVVWQAALFIVAWWSGERKGE